MSYAIEQAAFLMGNALYDQHLAGSEIDTILAFAEERPLHETEIVVLGRFMLRSAKAQAMIDQIEEAVAAGEIEGL